jgi:hypothetical protein
MSVVALAISIVCFIGTYACVTFAARVARERRDYRALLAFMTELDDNHEALAASHKRLRSRVGMRELRARRKEPQNAAEADLADKYPDTAETDREKWKREMRIKLHTGEVKP